MWKALAAGTAAAGLGCLLRSEYEKRHFVTEEIQISSSKIHQEKRLIFITDVHDKEFGPANEKLFTEIRRIKPDGILIGGDVMVTKGVGSLEVTFRLLEGLTRIAPVFYGLGNHEMRLRLERDIYGRKYEELLEHARKLGVVMLSDQTVAFGELDISGVNLHSAFYKKLLFEKPVKMPADYLREKLGAAENDRFQILMMHSPMYFKECREWGADLTLSGHFHGGTIRIPGLGGVMTPQLQFFVPWCAGTFCQDGKWMAVGRGLGTHSINIRLNDKPQVLVIRLVPG
ncbi:MAG: metallophosphoesterase [Lachnospiraceae bacterium]|nr:metallophosphoesterase [Lachnospiraceae bacterium]